MLAFTLMVSFAARLISVRVLVPNDPPARYDIQTQRCDVYGSGEGYGERTMLLYDGLHYDAMVLAYEAGAYTPPLDSST